MIKRLVFLSLLVSFTSQGAGLVGGTLSPVSGATAISNQLSGSFVASTLGKGTNVSVYGLSTNYDVFYCLSNVIFGIDHECITPSSPTGPIFIGGGLQNTNNARASFVGNGFWNQIEVESDYSSIVGGSQNQIMDTIDGGFIGGGGLNIICSLSQSTFIGGGGENVIGIPDDLSMTSAQSAIVGGSNNKIRKSQLGFIGGGVDNQITNSISGAILAGNTNMIRNAQGAQVVGNGIVATTAFSVYFGFAGNATEVKSNGVVVVPTFSVTGSGGITLATNSTAPANTTTIRAWVTVTNSTGGVFKMPLYQ